MQKQLIGIPVQLTASVGCQLRFVPRKLLSAHKSGWSEPTCRIMVHKQNIACLA